MSADFPTAISELRAELDRCLADREFLRRDQQPLEARCHQASAEVDALRDLVRDLIAATVPNLSRMDPRSWAPDDWQWRAQRAAADIPIQPTGGPTDNDEEIVAVDDDRCEYVDPHGWRCLLDVHHLGWHVSPPMPQNDGSTP